MSADLIRFHSGAEVRGTDRGDGGKVAAWLSATEGRAVSIHEVRRIEAQALRKLRQEFTRRGLFPADLLPER